MLTPPVRAHTRTTGLRGRLGRRAIKKRLAHWLQQDASGFRARLFRLPQLVWILPHDSPEAVDVSGPARLPWRDAASWPAPVVWAISAHDSDSMLAGERKCTDTRWRKSGRRSFAVNPQNSPVSRGLAEFAAARAPGWSERGSRSYHLSDQSAGSRLEQPQAGPQGAAQGCAA
jgi:hypothetical protein